jgi:hypothetical protein
LSPVELWPGLITHPAIARASHYSHRLQLRKAPLTRVDHSGRDEGPHKPKFLTVGVRGLSLFQQILG